MKEHFFDKKSNVTLFIRGLFAICVLLVGADIWIRIHGEFGWDGFTGFYAAFGFVACVGLVLTAKSILRKLVKRREDYYD